MKKNDAVAQKMKGKAQKAIGEYQMQTGQGLKGGISKAKGELNEKLADAKMKFGRKKDDVKDDLDDAL